jgi:hypothetical protein
LASYVDLGTPGPNTAGPDQTGRNTGNLTNQLTSSFINITIAVFECYHMIISNVPVGAAAVIMRNGRQYSYVQPYSGSEWDPAQPMGLFAGDEIDFLWDIPALATYSFFGQAAVTGFDLVDGPYTLGVQFSSISAGTLGGLWFYSPAGAVAVPATIALWTAAGVLVTSNAASWSGAAGSGWIYAAFTAPPVLAAGAQYVAGVFYGGTSAFAAVVNGSLATQGLVSGPLTAPSDAASVHGQMPFSANSTLTFPAEDSGGNNLFVDVSFTAGTNLAPVVTAYFRYDSSLPYNKMG